ncbi:FHA domain-containing protein [Chloroflexota bacterium]
MSTRKTFSLIIVLIILLSSFWYPVVSQSVVNSLIVTSLDATQFPQISLTARILNHLDKPVDVVNAEEITITEDSEAVSFDIQKTPIGISMILVIDINAAAKAKPARDATNFDYMKVIAQRYVESMGQNDRTAIVVTRPESEGQTLFQDFSANKDALTLRLDELRFGDPISSYSFPLNGVDTAVQMFKQVENAQPVMAVVLISTGIFDANQANVESSVDTISKDARANKIPIYTIMVNTDDDPRHLDILAQKSAGLFAQYNGPASLDGLFGEFDANRLQYLITYRSRSGSVSERRLVISLTGESSQLAIQNFTVNPPPLAPEIELLIVNNGDPIIREASAWDGDLSLTEVQVLASFGWPDGYERSLAKADLWIDGQIHGEPLLNPSGELIFPWDLRSYSEKGRKTARLEVRIKGELGFTARSMRQEPVDVVIPDKPEEPVTPIEEIVIMPVCDNLAKIPELGEWLNENCRKLGITPTQVINLALLFITLLLVILLWFNRSTVSRAGREVAFRANDFYQRITQRTGGQQPKARIEAIRGLSEGERSVFDIFGETPIGRDREHAELVFVNHPHISREHCIIHEDKASGFWTLEDRESANGTYLNGMRLQPFQKYPLVDGDTIEMAQIERGGIKCKFYIVQQRISRKPDKLVLVMPETPLESDVEQTANPRGKAPVANQGQEDDFFQTQQIPRQNLMDDTANAAPPEDDFDPSQQTF